MTTRPIVTVSMPYTNPAKTSNVSFNFKIRKLKPPKCKWFLSRLKLGFKSDTLAFDTCFIQHIPAQTSFFHEARLTLPRTRAVGAGTTCFKCIWTILLRRLWRAGAPLIWNSSDLLILERVPSPPHPTLNFRTRWHIRATRSLIVLALVSSWAKALPWEVVESSHWLWTQNCLLWASHLNSSGFSVLKMRLINPLEGGIQ